MPLHPTGGDTSILSVSARRLIKRTKPTAQSLLSARITIFITKTRKYVGSNTNQALSYYVATLNYECPLKFIKNDDAFLRNGSRSSQFIIKYMYHFLKKYFKLI